MSYCVHCGVKLAPSEARCPLCQTPVVDPVTPYDPSVPKEFPTRVREQEFRDQPWRNAGVGGCFAGSSVADLSLCGFAGKRRINVVAISDRCLFDDFLRGASACSMPKESVSLVGCGG